MKKELEYIQKNFKDKINNKPKKLYKYKVLTQIQLIVFEMIIFG